MSKLNLIKSENALINENVNEVQTSSINQSNNSEMETQLKEEKKIMENLNKSGNAQMNEIENEAKTSTNEEKMNRYLKESKGNMYKFVSHTFNPIIGKCEHECGYCYVSKLVKNQKPIRLEEEALKDSLGSNNFIFVGSGTDVFAKDVPSEWITEVLDYCNQFNNKYLFQSKNPERFLELIEHPVFKKSVICTTIESNRDYKDCKAPSIKDRVSAIELIKSEHPTIEIYVTIEPVMDFDLPEMVDLIKRCQPIQVNIGADSKGNNLPEPSKENLSELIAELSKFTTVKEKNNLKRIMVIEDPMKKELAKAKKEKAVSRMTKVQIMEKTDNGYNIKEEYRKLGLIKENRKIKDVDVNGFLQTIANGEYDESFPIITAEATELIDTHNITDLEGKALTAQEAKDYLIVLDGQHRTKAFVKLNAIRTPENQIVIPNVRIKKGVNVRKYLAEINMVGHNWSAADKVCVSAISSGNKLLAKVNEMIKQDFNVSTATTICIGRRLKMSELKNILSKNDLSCLEDEKFTIEERLNRAERFITTAMSIQEMTVNVLTKRFFINGFDNFAAARTDEEAFKALAKLTIDDFKSVHEDKEFVEMLKAALPKAA